LDTSITLLVFGGLFGFAWLFQLLHYSLVMGAFTRHQPKETPIDYMPLSVVICAKNEAENLKAYLPLILNQDYPDFQVVVVNDCSTDESEMVLAQLKEKHPHLYYTSIPIDKKFYHGKKLALTLGIKAAIHEHVVLTDADCYPVSDKWLTQMATSFQSGKEIILGYGAYETQKGFLNHLIRFETFWNTVQYFGFSLTIKPFMGVGRNLAYKKELFHKRSVFKKHLNLASGDDDLFVLEVAQKSNTNICYSADSHTISVPPRNWEDWKNQRKRHLSSSLHYPWLIKSWLILEPLTRQILWLLTLSSIFFPNLAPYIGALFLSLTLYKLVVTRKAQQKLNEKRLYWSLLIFDWLMPILLGILWINNLLRPKKIKWK
jgi:glycosyltransferase involved in cell wall biosynthesis